MARPGVQLSQIVPWGRTLAEYVGMFALSQQDLGRAHPWLRGRPRELQRGNVRARLPGCVMRSTLRLQQPGTTAAVRRDIRDDDGPDAGPARTILCGELSRLSRPWARCARPQCNAFLRDFARGKLASRYVVSALPHLAFADHAFDLGLCSNFLFLYSEHLGTAFHIAALRELCRIATEVRVFPLVDLDGRVSPHLAGALTALQRDGFHAAVRAVPYEFLKGANEMLVIAPADR